MRKFAFYSILSLFDKYFLNVWSISTQKKALDLSNLAGPSDVTVTHESWPMTSLKIHQVSLTSDLCVILKILFDFLINWNLFYNIHRNSFPTLVFKSSHQVAI